MTTLEPIQTHTSMAQRLAEGRIPAPEAFRYAILLAEALRRIHDAGHAHGAVSPANIALTVSGLELLPAPAPSDAVTPYTAPEMLGGRPPAAASDVFSLGTVVFEMLTGRKAFEGDTPEELAEAILMSAPPSTGNPAIDGFFGRCLAKEPTARLHPMQRIATGLKLLSVTERCTEAVASRRKAEATAVLRAEMQQVEERLIAHLQVHEKTMADMQSAVSNALDALREQLHAVGAELAAAQGRAEQGMEAFGEQITSQVQQIVGEIGESLARVDRSAGEAGDQAMRAAQRVGAVDERITRLEQGVSTVGERIGPVEQGLDDARARMAVVEQGLDASSQSASGLREVVAGQLLSLEKTLTVHAAAIESERIARAQTDDMVERVVEALELLQLTVLDQAEGRAIA